MAGKLAIAHCARRPCGSLACPLRWRVRPACTSRAWSHWAAATFPSAAWSTSRSSSWPESRAISFYVAERLKRTMAIEESHRLAVMICCGPLPLCCIAPAPKLAPATALSLKYCPCHSIGLWLLLAPRSSLHAP